MPKKVSARGAAVRMKAEDKKARAAAKSTLNKNEHGVITFDSFQNFQAKLGIGTENLASYGSYGFNPITRIRPLLEWMHRGSWLAGVAVDCVADDMTKNGVTLKGIKDPEEEEHIHEEATRLEIWPRLNDTIKWGRLYGGALGVHLVSGQDMKTPFRIQTVGKGQYMGILPLDRWMVNPALNELVNEFGPSMGDPKFYDVTTDGPALRGQRIHHSRCVRVEGVRLPYWQRVQDNLWGISVLERLYDRMLAFDSATQGAAQLVYKSYIRTYGISGLRDTISQGGDAINGIVKYVDMMAKFQSIEGVTLMDNEDTYHADAGANFGGLSDALTQFGQQLSGALQIPLVRLFGQSPAGFSTGETDLRMYYDGILQQQERMLRIHATTIYRAIAQSLGIQLEDGFQVKFNPLWQLTESEKAGIAQSITSTVLQARESGLIRPDTGMKELRGSAEITGIWGSITDEDIEEAEAYEPPAPELAGVEVAEVTGGSRVEAAEVKERGEADMDTPMRGEGGKPDNNAQNAQGRAAKDSLNSVSKLAMFHGLHVVIENPRGSVRRGVASGKTWESVLPDDYGYIRLVAGEDGDNLDCFCGPNPESEKVWVIAQRNLKNRTFDEYKAMLGYLTKDLALEAYRDAYEEGLADKLIEHVREHTMDDFKFWMTLENDRLQKARAAA